jgi:sugar/nucleoside kinase (ribokinase family)
VAARRVDLSVATLGMLGDDSYGRQVLEMLAQEGIDVDHVALMADRQTVLCVVVTDKAGQHVFLGIKDHKPVERCPPEWKEIIPMTRSIFTNGYTMRDLLDPEDVMELLRLGRAQETPIFFDPGPSIEFIDQGTMSAVLALTDVLLLTAEEASFLVDVEGPEAAKALQALGPRAVVLKAGADGCYVAGDGQLIYHPGFEVELVDAVGAGDSFVSAFIAAYLRGGDWRDCAAVANAMGAAVAATQGAGRCVPPVEKLVALLADDPAARLLDSAPAHS